MQNDELITDFLHDGFALVRNAIPEDTLKVVDSLLKNNNIEGNQRNIEQHISAIDQLVKGKLLLNLAQTFLQGKASFVRAILFDKTSNKNWNIGWHQDKTIAVSKKSCIPNWKAWSEKNGITHVQPSAEVLDAMIILRIHLDTANRNNGCLKVLRSSHKQGILTEAQIEQQSKMQEVCLCEAIAGDILVMRPLLVHASGKNITPVQGRRVLHVEYSRYDLPGDLQWNRA